MGFIVFEEEAFNSLDAQLENFVKRMDRIRERSEDKTMNKWLDTQDVCQTLNICPRTVQTLRDNGTLAYTQISKPQLNCHVTPNQLHGCTQYTYFAPDNRSMVQTVTTILTNKTA